MIATEAIIIVEYYCLYSLCCALDLSLQLIYYLLPVCNLQHHQSYPLLPTPWKPPLHSVFFFFFTCLTYFNQLGQIVKD